MTVLYVIAFSFCLAAVCNLLLISMGLALAGRRTPTPAVSYGAAMAMITGGAVFVIAAENFGVIISGAVMQTVEMAITLAAGPVFLLLTARLCQQNISVKAATAPAIAAAILIMFAVMMGADADIRLAVVVQMGYTIAAALSVMKSGSRQGRNSSFRLTRFLLTMMFVVHAAQMARMVAPHAPSLKAAVPVVISVFAFAIIFAAALRLGVRFARSRIAAGKFTLDEARLRELMRAENAFLSPEYRLADLAAAVELPAPELSRAINDQTDGGFVELLNSERLRYASSLLRDPEEARSSIEAIALLSGFRSRSAFYRAFTKCFRLTPAAYRREFLDDHLS